MYDDAGDSLLHLLPGQVARHQSASGPHRCRSSRAGIAGPPSTSNRNRSPAGVADRYALIVSYHYCHPPEGFLKGTKSITPDDLDRQLRVLRQNFVCTTMGELMNPHAQPPGDRRGRHVRRRLQGRVRARASGAPRWEVPATVYCSSAPLMDRRMLNVHRVHLLQARLGTDAVPRGIRAGAGVLGPISIEPWERLGLTDLYLYDDEPTRRFKRLLNFEVPYPALDVRPEAALRALRRIPMRRRRSKLYLSADDLRRCQDAGLEIGAARSRSPGAEPADRRRAAHDLSDRPADYFKSGIRSDASFTGRIPTARPAAGTRRRSACSRRLGFSVRHDQGPGDRQADRPGGPMGAAALRRPRRVRRRGPASSATKLDALALLA